MNIELYKCEHFNKIYCPYAGEEDNFCCYQTIKNCKKWREENFPEIKRSVEKEIKISRHKLEKLSKIILKANCRVE